MMTVLAVVVDPETEAPGVRLQRRRSPAAGVTRRDWSASEQSASLSRVFLSEQLTGMSLLDSAALASIPLCRRSVGRRYRFHVTSLR